jgi:hypothetical protein
MASREGVQLLEGIALPIQPHLLLYGMEHNATSSKAYPPLPNLHQIPLTLVTQPQSPSNYLPIASLVQAEVEGLQMLHALRS